MARSRTARHWRALASCALVSVVAACGFSGFGTGGDDGGSATSGGPANGDLASTEGGRATGEGGEVVIGSSEGGSPDGAAEAGAKVDAALDAAGFTCPAACTTCTGTTCNIACSAATPCASPVVCPPGIPCHITCSSTDACSMHSLSCAAATACRIDCTATHACQTVGVECGTGACRVECNAPSEACVAVSINAKTSASLCLQCRGTGGMPGCKTTDATKPMAGRPCNTSCAGGGCNANGNGLNGCADIASCPP